MSRRMEEVGGVFLQGESEIASINMVHGAAATGARVMTSSSSPGISLKQEGMSFLATQELPAVIVNIMRAGPGLGGILPSQADYSQATKGGGHGDYKVLVLAPWSVQEAADLVQDAFDLADYYRNPVFILGDGLVGQMMEPVSFQSGRTPCKELPRKDWAATGFDGSRPRAIINSLFLDPEELERHNRRLEAKYQTMVRDEVRFKQLGDGGECDVLIVAYGTVARVCSAAMEELEEQGLKVAMVRPISLYPYPYRAVREAAERARAVLVVELSTGQMIEDVRLALEGCRPIHFHSRVGGMLVTPEEVIEKVTAIAAGTSTEVRHA
jgi:2-oxoglutarate ferredoxin oxidoreductase subunit alpha